MMETEINLMVLGLILIFFVLILTVSTHFHNVEKREVNNIRCNRICVEEWYATSGIPIPKIIEEHTSCTCIFREDRLHSSMVTTRIQIDIK